MMRASPAVIGSARRGSARLLVPDKMPRPRQGGEPWKCRRRGKRRKPQAGLPTLSTSPLGISPKAGEIPTFPQLRDEG
jgi:hypothetical protein